TGPEGVRMNHIAFEIARRRCPKCKTEGSMQLQLAHASVVCSSCMASFIDPFEEGPWDDLIDSQVVDTVDGNRVSQYFYSDIPKVHKDLDMSKEVLEFYRFLRDS